MATVALPRWTSAHLRPLCHRLRTRSRSTWANHPPTACHCPPLTCPSLCQQRPRRCSALCIPVRPRSSAGSTRWQQNLPWLHIWPCLCLCQTHTLLTHIMHTLPTHMPSPTRTLLSCDWTETAGTMGARWEHINTDCTHKWFTMSEEAWISLT